jgi:hypothetical protein
METSPGNLIAYLRDKPQSETNRFQVHWQGDNLFVFAGGGCIERSPCKLRFHKWQTEHIDLKLKK